MHQGKQNDQDDKSNATNTTRRFCPFCSINRQFASPETPMSPLIQLFVTPNHRRIGFAKHYSGLKVLEVGWSQKHNGPMQSSVPRSGRAGISR